MGFSITKLFTTQMTSKDQRSRSNSEKFEVKYLKTCTIKRVSTCQYKLDKKSRIGFRIVIKLLILGDL